MNSLFKKLTNQFLTKFQPPVTAPGLINKMSCGYFFIISRNCKFSAVMNENIIPLFLYYQNLGNKGFY